MLIALDDVNRKNIELLVHQFGEQHRIGVEARYITNMFNCEEDPRLNGNAPFVAYRLTRELLRVEYGNR